MPCSKGEAGADGHRCPYREHEPQSVEGLEAWDTAMRCTGQARVAPSGRVVGLDLGVALHLGRAIGYGETALAELLPSIEAGMVAGVAKLIEQGADHGNE